MNTDFSLLQEVTEHYDDTSWLNENSDDLLHSIKDALKNEEERKRAIEALLLIFPHIIPLGQVKLWSESLRDAFDISLGEEELEKISNVFLTNTETEIIDKAISVALRRVRKRISPALMLEAYINLFQLQVYRITEGIDDNIILSAIDLARIVNEQASYARLNRALAYAYLRRGLYERSLEHARMAYNYYANNKGKVESAICAYAMALCYRFKQELDTAEYWLDIASNNFSQTKYPRQYALIAVEKGNIYLMREDFQTAYQWLTIANDEAQNLNPHTRATIQHSYGIVQSHLELFEDAEDSLNLSLRYWQDKNDLHQIAHLLYAFAFWAYKQGDADGALDYLNQSEGIYHTIENNPFNGQVMHLIENLRNKIAGSAK